MVQKNGYFQVEFRNQQAICHVYQPKEGGQRVSYRELASFLDAHGFSYDTKELNRKIGLEEDQELELRSQSNIEFSASIVVELDRNKTEAICRFYPPSKGGKGITVKDIMAALQQKQVIFGIDQDAIMDYMNHPVYCTDILLAKGKPAREGSDAYIEYFFNTHPNPKPAHNEDGTVDFHSLDVISHVQKGDLLAKLHPEDRGEPGRNLSGHETLPRPVKPAMLSVGRNIRLSDDRTEAYSEVTGHVKLYNGQIFVSDLYEVPADVDNSTGDIDYNGNVYVRGSIREGFQVNARGNVVIDGTVEGALVMAGGDIVIQRGVNGMNKGVLQAQGNIISKFIENTTVFAGGYVETGSIIHSEVSAKGDVVCSDKKGFITGGKVSSGGKIEAQTIGSTMGSATRLEVGMDPEKKERYNFLQNEISNAQLENSKINPILKNYQMQIDAGIGLDRKNQEYYIKLNETFSKNKDVLEEYRKEFEELKKLVENSKNSKVVVSKDIFAGVTVVCSDVSLVLKEKRSYCYIEKKDGELVIMNL